MKTEWFIQQLDSATNEALAKELTEENFLQDLNTLTGETINAWRCDYWLITYFQKSKSTQSLKFRVFYRRRRTELLKEWHFHKKKKLSKLKK
ncbi:MAG: hypothetical protein ABIJ81_03045 [Patescibacteria group bacterium]